MPDAPLAARRSVEDRPVRIVSARPTLIHRLRSIWSSRELLLYFVITDIKIKYKSSALGMVWSLLSPTLTLGIYWLVFGLLLKNGIPNFVVFLFAGLMVWNLFANIVVTSTGIIVDRAGVVKKVAFPREILALSTVGTALIYFAMQAVIMVIFMLATGQSPDWGLIWLLPISIIAVSLMAGAIGVFLSAVNVYLRDTKHLIEVLMQLWFYLTPIVYSFEAKVSFTLHRHSILWIYFLNPVTPIVMTFQKVLFNNNVVHSTIGTGPPTHLTYPVLKVLPTWPWTTYLELNLVLLAGGIVGMIVAITIFGRLEGNFAEEL